MVSMVVTRGPLYMCISGPHLVLAASCPELRNKGHGIRLLLPGDRAVSQGVRWTRLLKAEWPTIIGHQSDSLLYLRG